MTSLTPPAVVPASPDATATGAPPPGRRRRSASALTSLAGVRRWLSPLALLALWQVASATGLLDPRLLAAPVDIARTAGELVADGTLGAATLVSVQRVALGFAVGASVALALAVAAGLSRVVEDVVDPPLQMLRTLPHFGLIPLFILWFGIGETPKLALIALGVAFPLYLNTFAGIRNIDRRFTEAARAFHLSWGQRLRYVVLPGALPQTLTGLRQSLGIAWLSLIVAETVGADAGLGHMINQAREFLQTDVIVVGLVVYSLLGLATDGLVRFIERKALAWRA